jgi:hypothetical protein
MGETWSCQSQHRKVHKTQLQWLAMAEKPVTQMPQLPSNECKQH